MTYRVRRDKYYLHIAEAVAEQSTCLRRKVGAILVRDNYIISTGYNGAPTGLPHCEEKCLRENIPSGERHELCRGVHAEQNTIIQAALHGVSTRNSVLFCTHFPCIICAKMLINAGIAAIYYKNEYIDELSLKLLIQANIKLQCLRIYDFHKRGIK